MRTPGRRSLLEQQHFGSHSNLSTIISRMPVMGFGRIFGFVGVLAILAACTTGPASFGHATLEDDCEQVDLVDIYRAPAQFVGRTICSKGKIYDEGHGTGVVPELPHSHEDFPSVMTFAVSDDQRPAYLKVPIKQGSDVVFAGEVTIDPKCWDETVGELVDGKRFWCVPEKPIHFDLRFLRKL